LCVSRPNQARTRDTVRLLISTKTYSPLTIWGNVPMKPEANTGMRDSNRGDASVVYTVRTVPAGLDFAESRRVFVGLP